MVNSAKIPMGSNTYETNTEERKDNTTRWVTSCGPSLQCPRQACRQPLSLIHSRTRIVEDSAISVKSFASTRPSNGIICKPSEHLLAHIFIVNPLRLRVSTNSLNHEIAA